MACLCSRSCYIALIATSIVAIAAIVPVDFVAGEEFEDIGHVELYWWVDTSTILFNAGDPINHSIAFRFVPKSISPTADRIYVASGNKLIALRPATGQMAWHTGSPMSTVCCYDTPSEISTDPIAANFGSVDNPYLAQYVVYVGTTDGSIHFLREAGEYEIDQTDRRSLIPHGEDVLEVQADGSIISSGVYSDVSSQVNHDERVFFGTSNGWLYAYPAHFDAVTWDDATWFYDFSLDEWQKGDELNRPYRRIDHELVFDTTRDRVQLFGGRGFQVNTELWHLDSTLNWTEENVSYPQTQVNDPALVYHEGADALLLFGGEATSGDVDQLLILNLTESEWQPLSPTASPPRRHAHRMVYSTQDEIVMLFGGLSDGAFVSDTWMFSLANTSWWSVSAPGPASRLGHSMVYDSTSNRAIIFGGFDGSQLLNDTWAFDFLTSSWTQIATGTAPSPRSNHSMAFDTLSGNAVLFGGNSSAGILDDTWTFDVSTDLWEEKNPSTSPPARLGHSMTVNSSSQRAVLFGGNLEEGKELWKRNFGDEPVRFEGVPLGPGNCPRRSPALDRDGITLVINDGNGYLRAVNTSNGMDRWSVWIGDSWTTAPVVTPGVVEVGSDWVGLVATGSNDGWLYAFYTDNGTTHPDVDELGMSSPLNPSLHGVQVMVDGVPDGGAVASLSWDYKREQLLVGTSSHYLHLVRLNAYPAVPAGTTLWSVRTAGTVQSPPYQPIGLEAFYFVDATGRLHALESSGLIGYRIKLDGNASATPIVWKDEQGSGHLYSSVWIGDSLGRIYSWSSMWGVETTPPSISDITADPSPQEVHGYVNISAIVEDASGVESVWVDIEGVGNYSMAHDSSAGRYYLNRKYSSVGTLDFTIAAKDVRDNWANAPGQLVVEDTTPPVISHVPVASATIFEAVDVVATVVDNFQVNAVLINFTGVDGVSYNETMMGSGNNYSFQIPAQNSTGPLTYFIWSEDTEGNNAITPIHTTSIVSDTLSPSPPTDLVVRDGEEEGSLHLSWTAPTINTDGSPLTDLAGYEVYRMTSSGGERTPANVEPVVTTEFNDTGLESGKTYHYVVRAVDFGGRESSDSNEASGTTSAAGLGDWLWIPVLLIVIAVIVLALFMFRRRTKGKNDVQQES